MAELYFFFFFSSRRRHTRLQGDWSSDVCSSDLRLRIGIDQELRGVEALAGVRVVRAVHAVPVALPWPDAGQVAVPVERRALLDVDPLLVPVPVVQAELDALGVLREEREVRALAVPLRPERERLTGPHGSHLSSTVVASKSATSVRSPRRSVRTLPWASTSSS